MEHFHKAESLYVDEHFSDAVEEYTLSAKECTDCSEIFAHRAAAYVKLKKYMNALEDCNRVIQMSPQCERCYYRKGLCLFALEDYESAKSAYVLGLDLCKTLPVSPVTENFIAEYNRAIRKCDSELSQEAEEMKKKMAAKAAAASSSSSSSSSATLSAAKQAIPTLPLGGIKYQYYQSDQKLTIDILAKNLTADNVEVTLTPDSIKVVCSADGASEVVMDKTLYDNIVVDKCKTNIKKSKVEIVLVKEVPRDWSSLEGAPKKKPLPAASASAAAAAPSAAPKQSNLPKAYATQKDWNNLDRELEEELAKDKPQGEEALNVLFRDIYSKASPETRRAMNKSMQTSGGTVLSTNWNEVKDKDYEKDRQAPKGVEWKDWEGNKKEMKELD